MKRLSTFLLFNLLLAGSISAQQPSCIAHVWPAQWTVGSAVLTVKDSSGTGTPIGYLWSNGATTSTLSVPNQGTYCCTITYSDGCTASDCFTFEPCRVYAYWAGFDGPSGKMSVIATRYPDYLPGTYLWSTGAATEYVLVDSPGMYCVTVTQADGCTATACTETVGTPCSLAVNYTLDTTVGPRRLLLHADLTALGSSSYLWSTGDTSATLVAASGSEYFVSANNQMRCFQYGYFDFEWQASVQRIDDQLFAAANSKFPPYRYLWNNGAVSASISPDQPGFYSVTVTDAADVTSVASKWFAFNCQATIQYTSPDTLTATCAGQPPFTYAWEPEGFHSVTILPDTSGYYRVTITDVRGCSSAAGIYWYSPDSCQLGLGVIDSMAIAGFAWVFPQPYIYYFDWDFLWEDGSTEAWRRITESGQYCLTIVNKFSGCKATKCIDIQMDSLIPDLPSKIEVRPNPVRHRLEVLLPEAAEMWLADLSGRNMRYQQGDSPKTAVEMSDLPAGMYFLTVRTAAATQTLKVLKE